MYDWKRLPTDFPSPQGRGLTPALSNCKIRQHECPHFPLQLSAKNLLAEASIHIPPISNIVHENVSRIQINFIHNTVVSDSYTVQPFGPLQLCRLRRKRIRRQAFDPRENTGNERAGNRLEIFFDGGFVAETIEGHACGAASSYHQPLPAFHHGVLPPRQDHEDPPSGVNSA